MDAPNCIPVSYSLPEKSCSPTSHALTPGSSSYSSWIYGYLSTFWGGEDLDSKDTAHFRKYIGATDVDLRGMMLWPAMERGTIKRAEDERLLEKLINDVKAYRSGQNAAVAIDLPETSKQISEIVYGRGETVASRQAYLEQYGCAAYTEEALQLIACAAQGEGERGRGLGFELRLGSSGEGEAEVAVDPSSPRGIVELGAGHGQWARQLVDRFGLDMVAFDSMVSLPTVTISANGVGTGSGGGAVHSAGSSRFFGRVLRGSERVFTHDSLVEQHQLHRRLLLVVFPDPGGMALRCLRNYTSLVLKSGGGCVGGNKGRDPEAEADTRDDSALEPVLMYVGEGRGGANADHAFFDELESGRWVLERSCALRPFGSKGYERLFVFRHRGEIVSGDRASGSGSIRGSVDRMNR